MDVFRLEGAKSITPLVAMPAIQDKLCTIYLTGPVLVAFKKERFLFSKCDAKLVSCRCLDVHSLITRRAESTLKQKLLLTISEKMYDHRH